jgi:hypothetical protein
MVTMRELRVLPAVLLAAVMAACGTFYANPGANDPAAVFIEVSEKSGLIFTRSIMVADVDGKPVSHMGAGGDGWEIRIVPGQRRMLFRVNYYKKDEQKSIFSMESSRYTAYFPVLLAPQAGKRYRLGSSVAEGERVTFTITDLSQPNTPWVSCMAVARRDIPGTTIALPGGTFATIPGRSQPTQLEGCVVAETSTPT